tara:strand:- start:2221 stop:2436 length:216 start_codon:yes stop_codon:yes gene_type:complete
VKSTELNQMNILELKTRLTENLDSLQNLRFQQSLQQLEDGTIISRTRREIAQIKTVLNEFKIGLRKEKGEQ